MRTLISLTLFLSFSSGFFLKLSNWLDVDWSSALLSSRLVHQPVETSQDQLLLMSMVSVRDSFVVEGNAPSDPDTLLFVVERSDDATSFTVAFQTSDGTAKAADWDYAPTSGNLTFTATSGILTDTVKVPVIPDNKTELDEVFNLNLTGVTDIIGTTTISNNIGLGTIQNNDTSYLSIRDTVMAEGNTGSDSMQFVIDLTGDIDTMFQFSFSTMDASATTANNDYVSRSGLLFGSGSGIGSGTGVGSMFYGIDTIAVAINGDTKTEREEDFKVVLSAISAGGRAFYFLNNDSTAQGTIINDDTGFLTIQDVMVLEGDNGIDTLRFPVSLNLEADTLAIVYRTVDGTAAVLDTDYEPISRDTLHLNCLLSDTLKVPVIGDTRAEPNETVKIEILEILPGNRAVSLSDSIALGYLINDDNDPTISDPCTCLNNATGVNTGDGQFSETVQVTSLPGETWYITQVNGLFQAPSGQDFPPSTGGNPYPLNPFITGAAGQKLTESDQGNGLSHYVLNGIHVDGIGYEIWVTNGSQTLSIGNLCHYETACSGDQTIVMPFHSNTGAIARLKDCKANNLFIDDGIHLYRDEEIRNSSTTICPNVKGQILSVTFRAFDLAQGDSLWIYDGIDSSSAFIAKGGGNSISQINGGWVTSSCDPNINPSGCLTFVFKTNGDKRKGTGWEATVSCEIMDTTTLNRVNDVFATTNCDSLKTPVNLRIPTINRSNGTCNLASEDIIVTYCNVRDTLMAGQLVFPVFPFGSYGVEYKLLADTTITTSNRVHVSTPPLACNDTLTSSIGQYCAIMLRPDDILENPCDTTGQQISPFYSIRVKTDTGFVMGTAPNFPILDAGKNGNVTCNNFYEVTIYRRMEVAHAGCTQIQTDSCTSVVRLIDGISPVFVSVEEDTIFGCYGETLSQDMLTAPNVVDNCQLDTLMASISPNMAERCDTSQLVSVIWTAVDLCGNISVATQNVVIKRPRTMVIPADTMISCGADISPAQLGWPLLDSNGDNIGDQQITDSASFCNFELFYKDETIPGTCGSDLNILRIFTLFDNCENAVNHIFSDTQYILLRDTIAPEIHCPATYGMGSLSNPYRFYTAYNSCMGSPGDITPPAGTDNCDQELEHEVIGIYSADGSEKFADNLNDLSPLETGTYRMVYTLKDDCGNVSDPCNIYFSIADQTNPTAICSDELIISMAHGNQSISAQDISSGSFDVCGLDTMFIRRTICGSATEYEPEINLYVANRLKNGEPANGWSGSIEIGCCDINTTIKVQLLVFDKSGNYNKCWLTIRPENQPQAVCGDLPDVRDYCDNFAYGDIGRSTDENGNNIFEESEWRPVEEHLLETINEQFGNPACNPSAHCQHTSIEQEYQLIRQLCGVQRMKRRFRTKALDQEAAFPWHYQNITIDYRPGWSITFPPDTTFQCGTSDPGSIPEMPLVINNGTCDQIGWEVQDEVFETEDAACFKIFRKWYVLNACQHSNIQQPFTIPRDQVDGKVSGNSKRTFTSTDTINGTILSEQGYLTYTQVIVVMDNEAPVITLNDVDTCITGVLNAAPLGQADDSPGTAPYKCDTVRLFSATGSDCIPSDQLEFHYEIFEGDVRVQFGEGSSFEYVVQPNISYRVVFTASDNCGNSSQAERIYTFRDCRRPVADCTGIHLGLDTRGEAIVSAAAINNNSYDNCTNISELELRIWHPSLGIPAPDTYTEVIALPNAVMLTCADYGRTTARLYVVDQAQLFDYCAAQIVLIDPPNTCNFSRTALSGQVQNVNGDMVEGVEVDVSGNGLIPEMVTTDSDGYFYYELQRGADYTITPKKSKNPLNGVSTFDLVLIQKHVLGIKLFDSPYDYIAADVNGSGTVSAYDMVILRQLILNVIPEFPGNQSWRFINMDYPMADDPLTDGFAEDHHIDAMEEEEEINFMAVKIGDVNGSARANDLVPAEDRNNLDHTVFQVEDRTVEKGKTYLVDFYNEDLENISGYQFTLQFSGLTFKAWEKGMIREKYFSWRLAERGYISTSWNPPPGFEKDQQKLALFQLSFVADRDGSLKDMLRINSSVTKAEAYSGDNDLLDVQLAFSVPQAASGTAMELYQNRPNPFKEETQIGFYLPQSSAVIFRMTDLTGRVLKTIKNDFEKGHHSIEVRRDELPQSGLIYYQLESSAGKITKTMLILD